MRVALERHVGRHLHRAVRRHASEVVAPEVDEHHVFGALLLVALQLLGEPHVLFLGAAARARAGDRMRLHQLPFDAHQHLGRRADDRAVAHAEEIHVRRRIHVPKRPVGHERIGVERASRTAATARPGRCRRRRCTPSPCGPFASNSSRVTFDVIATGSPSGAGRLRQRPLELALDELDLGARELVQRLEVLVARDARVGDDQDPVPHVVERQHRVEQHEARFVLDVGGGLQFAPARTRQRRRSPGSRPPRR